MTKRFASTILGRLMIGLLVLLLIFGNLFLVMSLDIFGSPLPFAFGLILEIILLVLLSYNLIRAFKSPLRIITSILCSAGEGVLRNSFVKRFGKKYPLMNKWLANRFDNTKPRGLVLTTGVFISLIFLIKFACILQSVVTHGSITRIDTRIINLMPNIRTPLQTSFFRDVTFAANAEAIILLVIVVVVVLWRARQRLLAGYFFAAYVAQEGGGYVLKHIVQRARPDRSLSLYKEDSFSFPSGHVQRATVIYGLLAYLLYRSFKSTTLRLWIIISYLVSVVLVALSRVYLGVHYPSDVIASVFIGASLLTLIITGLEIAIRYRLRGVTIKKFGSKWLALVPAIIVILSIIAGPYLIKLSVVNSNPTIRKLEQVDTENVKKLPLYSETLTGKRMEPINFIYFGSAKQIEQQFFTHGWYKADPSTLSNTLRALAVGFQGDQYLNAPVTPSYLDAQPETLAFQQPTQANTLRQRHHTRLWRTNFKLTDGTEIWEATASYDESIELSSSGWIPTHRIDPNVDGERTYIIKSLQLNANYLPVVHPQSGKNAGGDTFFTDGQAAVVRL